MALEIAAEIAEKAHAAAEAAKKDISEFDLTPKS